MTHNLFLATVWFDEGGRQRWRHILVVAMGSAGAKAAALEKVKAQYASPRFRNHRVSKIRALPFDDAVFKQMAAVLR